MNISGRYSKFTVNKYRIAGPERAALVFSQHTYYFSFDIITFEALMISPTALESALGPSPLKQPQHDTAISSGVLKEIRGL